MRFRTRAPLLLIPSIATNLLSFEHAAAQPSLSFILNAVLFLKRESSAIYASGAGHFGRSFWGMNWGQNYLSQVSDETGGEAYFLGYETAVLFAPYLRDLMRRLNHQYLLAFIPKPEKKPDFNE